MNAPPRGSLAVLVVVAVVIGIVAGYWLFSAF
jgi:hypothetical protein